MSELTRRQLIERGLAAAPALALAGMPGSAVAASRRVRRTSSSRVASLPSAREVERQVREMVELGPRLPATSAHLQFVDSLEDGFRDAGLRVERDPHPFQQWLARRSSLDVLTGPAAGPVPIASEYTYSGKTGPEGVTGELVYLGPVPSPPGALP